jgi:hypothetical protein
MSGLLVVVALLGIGLGGAEPGTVAVFQPGNEGRALELIAPHGFDDLILEGWTLEGMTPGPECAVRFTFARGDARVRYVFGVSQPEGGAAALRVEEATTPDPAPLTRAFSALLNSNDHAAIFRDACLHRIADSREEIDTAEAVLLDPFAPVASDTGKSLLVLLPLVLLGFYGLRRPHPAPPRSRRSTTERSGLAILVGVAILLRVLVGWYLGPVLYELENFPRNTNLWGLGYVIGSFTNPPPPQTFHAPLLDSLLQGWSGIGDALGVGGELRWLRLPNVVLSGVMVWLLVRLGEALGDARIGWIAGATFAASPLLIQFSVPQGHYFLEMVAVTWFLERLASCVVAGRPAHRSLAIAAATALWSGFLSAVVVGPGLLVHMVRCWRQGDRRRGLSALLLVLALTAPVIGTAFSNALDMSVIARHTSPTPAANAALAAVYGHTPMEPAADGVSGMLELGWNLTTSTVGVVAAPLFLCLLLLAVALRPRDRWGPPLIFLAFVTLGTALPLRTTNFTALIPVLLIGGIQATLDAIDRFLPRRLLRPAIAGLLLCILGGALGTGSKGAMDRTPLAVQMSRWLTEGHFNAVIEVAMAPEHRHLPVVWGTWTGDTAYHLCPDRTRRAAVVDCMDRPKTTPLPGLLRYTLQGRDVLELRMPPGDTMGCPPTLDPDVPRAEMRGPLLLALGPYFVADIESMDCPDPRDGRDCRSIAAAPEVELWLCER